MAQRHSGSGSDSYCERDECEFNLHSANEVFLFPRFGNNTNCGVEFRFSRRLLSIVGRKIGNGMEWNFTRSPFFLYSYIQNAT